MYGWNYTGWANAWLGTFALGVEASTVIGLRMAKITCGGAGASDETQRMIAEKIASTLELQAALVSGNLGADPLQRTQRVLRHYRRKVGANRRRLG